MVRARAKLAGGGVRHGRSVAGWGCVGKWFAAEVVVLIAAGELSPTEVEKALDWQTNALHKGPLT